jgi:hypothetical protein
MGKRIFGLAALIGVVGAMSVAGTASAAPPLQLDFSKHTVGEGVWEGTVSGDITGGLTTRAIAIDQSDPVWQVTFDWIVDGGMQSFTARLSGTLDSNTGAVAMKGRVVEGYLAGSKVREEGQLVDPNTLAFQGTIRVNRPGPAH